MLQMITLFPNDNEVALRFCFYMFLFCLVIFFNCIPFHK
uniref:Uncharacterized protein n=1 Tax=Arundo donax TaxID=35708 RepID=A0A0A9BA10_ARUDO